MLFFFIILIGFFLTEKLNKKSILKISRFFLLTILIRFQTSINQLIRVREIRLFQLN